jgi:hypothetical protein
MMIVKDSMDFGSSMVSLIKIRRCISSVFMMIVKGSMDFGFSMVSLMKMRMATITFSA